MAATTHYIRGVANWAKIIGPPRPNYSKDGMEWTIDVTPDQEGIKLLKQLKLNDRLKDKDDDRGEFIQFRQREKRADGQVNQPIAVVEANGKPFPEDKLIGNGSVVDVKFRVQDYGPGKKKGIYPQAVRVLELKEFERQDFAPLSEDDKYFQENVQAVDEEHEDTFRRDFGIDSVDNLDDDIPE